MTLFPVYRYLVNRLLNIALYLLICFNATATSNSVDYSTCIDVPEIGNTDFLLTNTLFGVVKNSIRIGRVNNYSTRCDDQNMSLQFEYVDSNGNLISTTTIYEGTEGQFNKSLLPSTSQYEYKADIPLTAIRFGRNKLCLTMPTIYGQAPITCKQVPPLENIQDDADLGDDEQVPECTFYSPSCIEDRFNSQTLLNFSGRAVQCLWETLDSVFFTQTICPSESKIRQTPLSPFPTFQKSMQHAVMAFLTIYVIAFGMQTLLAPEKFSASQAFMAALKIIVVLYFATGLGKPTYKDGKEYVANGVTEWGLPLLTNAAGDFTSFIFNAINTEGLCYFNRNNYPAGKEYYALWDSLDCRIGYYFGLLPSYNVSRSFDNLPSTLFVTKVPVQEVRVVAPTQDYFQQNDLYLVENAYNASRQDVIDAANATADGAVAIGGGGNIVDTVESTGSNAGSSLERGAENADASLDNIRNPQAPSGFSTSENTYQLEDQSRKVDSLALDREFNLRFFTAIWGYMLVGSILVVAACVSFTTIFIMLVLKLLTTFLLSLITLHVLAYFSPIFVPMALFERTKGYFDGWLKICISCAIRPAIIAGFISMLVVVYDGLFFRDCQFVHYEYSDGSAKFSTFNLAFPIVAGEPDTSCQDSMGYRLFKKYLGYDWDYTSLLLFRIYYVTDGWIGLENVAYLFLWTMTFYYFSQTMEALSSDISGGPRMDSVTVGMDTLMKGIKMAANAAQAANAARKASGGDKDGGDKGGGDKGGGDK